MIGLALAMMLSGATVTPDEARYIRQHYPVSIRPLITQATALSGTFVNAPENSETKAARRSYDRVEKQLKAKGWCWGSADRDAPDSQMTWLRCRVDRTHDQ